MGQTALVPSPKGEEEVKCAVEKEPVIRGKDERQVSLLTPEPATAPGESSVTAVWLSSTLILLDINLNGLWNGLLLGVLVKTAKAESLNLFPS